MADVAARAILDMQAKAPAGDVSAELELDADFLLVVHQASGMISVQLGIPVGEALARLRAYSFAIGSVVGEVAARVVRRDLRFDEPPPASG